MKKVTIVNNDGSVIYIYTGNDELKIDEDFKYFTVYSNGCATSYQKGRYNIKVEYSEEE